MRFASVVDVAYNYYSSGDEVLEILNEMPDVFSGGLFHLERFAWHKQEIFKGTDAIGGTSWAGWGFNQWVDWDNLTYTNIYSVEAANTLSNSVMKIAPVFCPDPSVLFSTNMINDEVDEMLTMGIPALSYPAGRAEINIIGFRNISFNMESLEKPNGWLNRGGDYQTRWLHNDLKNVAYLYNYGLFKKLITDGELQ